MLPVKCAPSDSYVPPTMVAVVQGDHVQLTFFKYFENGQKLMKSPKPSDQNADQVRTFSYLRLLGPLGLMKNVTALISEPWILMGSG